MQCQSRNKDSMFHPSDDCVQAFRFSLGYEELRNGYFVPSSTHNCRSSSIICTFAHDYILLPCSTLLTSSPMPPPIVCSPINTAITIPGTRGSPSTLRFHRYDFTIRPQSLFFRYLRLAAQSPVIEPSLP